MIKVRLKDEIPAWYIKPGIWYSAERSLTTYDATTFNPSFYYLITCDDGLCRKFDVRKFITIDEWRKDRLEDLGI
jgi:hypothetical protein